MVNKKHTEVKESESSSQFTSKKVYVRKEYLTDHQTGFGEFVEGVWVSAKSIPGRAFYFETYLSEYGVMYGKLPISAFLDRPETPKIPDFKVSTKYYQVENGTKWGRLGKTDEYFWETESESKK
jgi:hypothetical protein